MRLSPHGPADPLGPRAGHPAGSAWRTGAETGVPGRSPAASAHGDTPPGAAHPPSEVHLLVRVLPSGSVSRRARAVVRQALLAEGVRGDDIADAETVVAELAANCEWHARPPYEIRVFSRGGVPVWCELVDGTPDLGWIPALLDLPRAQLPPDPLAENGRGLLLVRELSQGHCRAYPTTAFRTGAPAKAVAFALPTRSGIRLAGPPPLHPGRHSVHLHREP
ncbi:ATP-binding protein [Streptosporangium violaceochromogenes]|nr:ATP-binding protein [Streptosporangium violaceochromogenes]